MKGEGSLLYELDCGEEVTVYFWMETYCGGAEEPVSLEGVEILSAELPDGTNVDGPAISLRNRAKMTEAIGDRGKIDWPEEDTSADDAIYFLEEFHSD